MKKNVIFFTALKANCQDMPDYMQYSLKTWKHYAKKYNCEIFILEDTIFEDIANIAFNDPGSDFNSETRVVDLTENTIQDNSRFFPTINDVPTQAVTMGLKPIMTSKRIILMAIGNKKHDILNKSMFGRLSEELPASVLQLHKNMEAVYCD